MGAVSRPVAHYLVPFGEHVVNCIVRVGVGGVESRAPELEALRASR